MRRARGGKIPVFTFGVSDDPRRGRNYLARLREIQEPVIVNQEFMLDYRAGTSGGLIESVWLPSCVDARRKIGHAGPPTGWRRVAFDPAGDGKNRCALAAPHGTDLVYLASWSGALAMLRSLPATNARAVRHMLRTIAQPSERRPFYRLSPYEQTQAVAQRARATWAIAQARDAERRASGEGLSCEERLAIADQLARETTH